VIGDPKQDFDDEKSLGIYLRQIASIPLLSAQQENTLARMAKEGDQAALDELTEANLRFVVSIAKEYQGRGLSLADLINEGNVGLLRAVKRFDPDKKIRFTSYAVWWIRQSILQALVVQARIVHVPMNKVDKWHKIAKLTDRFRQRDGLEPTHIEIAQELKLLNDQESEVLYLYLNSEIEIPIDRLGISAAELTRDAAERLSLDGPHGVVVERVFPRSPARQIGLRAGDVLLRFDGERVTGPSHLEALVSNVPPAQPIEIAAFRGNEEICCQVRLPAVPGQREPEDLTDPEFVTEVPQDHEENWVLRRIAARLNLKESKVRLIRDQALRRVSEVRKLLHLSRRQVSLDAPSFLSEESHLLDALESKGLPSPDEVLFEEDRAAALRHALATLTPREAKILSLYFGLMGEERLTLDAIGRKIQLSRERVRQIKERALRKLRLASRSDHLRANLG
jgi:RNA polymerase sigma factor (sigma-70 family)